MPADTSHSQCHWSVQHVVVDGKIYKAPDGFAGLRFPDAATMHVLAGRPKH